MNQVSLVEFRKDAESILRRVQRGERLVLTRRGRPVVRLEPVDSPSGAEDPFYRLAELATGKGTAMTNRRMDRVIYGL